MPFLRTIRRDCDWQDCNWTSIKEIVDDFGRTVGSYCDRHAQMSFDNFTNGVADSTAREEKYAADARADLFWYGETERRLLERDFIATLAEVQRRKYPISSQLGGKT